MKLNLFGNMPLILPRDPQVPMEASTKNYVDTTVSNHEKNQALHMTAAQNEFLDALTVTAAEVNSLAGLGGSVVDGLNSKVNKAGDTMTGPLHLHADPVDPNQAATKQYVDTADAKKLDKTGGTLSGFLTLHAAPETANQAATKGYTDAKVAAHADDADVHVPAGKIDFLRTITITGAEANALLGIRSNVQEQLDTKFDKAGGAVTGPVTLPGAPTEPLQAANKGYVDAEAAKKVSKAGDTMTGPLVLSGNPAAPEQASNKAYVDASVKAHADDDTRHLTAAQNTLLDSLTVTAQDINQLGGLGDTVANLLDKKLDKAGGTLTGDLTLADGKTVYVSKTPAADTELVNKAYVDAKVAGKEWRDPITATNLVSAALSTPPETPAEDDVYIIAAAPTGAWAGKAGYAVVWTKGAWKFLQEREVAVNDRFGVALTSKTAVGADLSAHAKKLVTVTNATVGALTFSEDPNTAGSTTLVFDADAPDFGVTYSFNDAGNWVPTNTSVNLKAGAGLQLNGSLLNVVPAKGVKIGDDNSVQLDVDATSALAVDGNGKLTSVVDGQTVVQTGAKLAVAPDVMAVINDAVTKAGTNSITGQINVQAGAKITAADAPAAAQDLTNKAYVDGKDAALQTTLDNHQTRLQTLETDPVTKTYVNQQDELKVSKAGDTMTGPLVLSGNPTTAMQSATKQYVDDSVKAHADDDARHLTADQNAFLDAVTVSAVEVNRLSGVKSNVQAQLDDRVPLAGGTMTGPLVLSGAPAAAAEAANKGYVDAEVAKKVSKDGDTMTGFLTLHAAPTSDMHAATKKFVDAGLSAHANNEAVHMTADQNAFLDAVTVTAQEVNQLAGVSAPVQTQLDSKVNKAGDTMTGFLTLHSAPTEAGHATTKKYTDDATALKLNKAGDTMTGPLVLSGAPVQVNEAATKQYVDGEVSTSATALTADINNRVAKAGDAMTGFLTLHAAPTLDMHAATKKFVGDSVQELNTDVTARLKTTNDNVSALRTDVDVLKADPVTKSYVDTQDAGRVAKAGDTMTGFLTLHSDPQSPMHAVTRQYVDAVAQGLAVKPAVRLATTVNLAGTYNNGTLGVNATLTGSTNGALIVDGKVVLVGDRVLLRVQTDGAQNGDYVVQQVGNSSTPFILKRVQTADESREIPSAFFYVADGDTLKGTGWTFIVQDPVTFSIGNDPIQVNQFSGQGSIIAGDGLVLEGNTVGVRSADTNRIVVTSDAIDLAPVGITPGLYTKVQVDGFGRVITGTNPTTLAGYGINDAQPLSTLLTSLASVTTKGVLVLDVAGNATTRHVTAQGVGLSVENEDGGSGNIVVKSNATSEATPGTVVARDASGNFSANVMTGALNGNASTATALKDSRNFSATGDVIAEPKSFNGTDNVVLQTALSKTGVTAGAYTKVTVDDKGRVTLGENPNTVAGYGIVDAATIDFVNQKFAEMQAQIDALHLYVTSRM